MFVLSKILMLRPIAHFISIEQVVKKSQAGGGVAVKIEHAVYQSAKMFGRHFDDKDEILSHISRQSIDVLKVRSAPLLPSKLLTRSIDQFQA